MFDLSGVLIGGENWEARLFSKHAVNDYSVSSKIGSPSSFMRSKSAFIKTEGVDEAHSIFR